MNYRYTPEEIGMLNAEIDRLRGALERIILRDQWFDHRRNGEKTDGEFAQIARAALATGDAPAAGKCEP